jgi:Na+/glutamate symporter
MLHYILILLKYVIPGLVIAGFVVWFLWVQLFSKKQ